jgi:hypothetical protein
MLPAPSSHSSFATALREAAAELGLPPLDDPQTIRTAIVQRDCDRASHIRQLESMVEIRTMRIAHLEGELKAAVSDCNEWSALAITAERRVLVAIALIVVLGVALVIVAGSRVGWGVL